MLIKTNDIITFGKYKGFRARDIDIEYLLWIKNYTNYQLDENLTCMVKNYENEMDFDEERDVTDWMEYGGGWL